MSGLRDEKNKVLEITKTCKACKRQCLNIRMDFQKYYLQICVIKFQLFILVKYVLRSGTQ